MQCHFDRRTDMPLRTSRVCFLIVLASLQLVRPIDGRPAGSGVRPLLGGAMFSSNMSHFTMPLEATPGPVPLLPSDIIPDWPSVQQRGVSLSVPDWAAPLAAPMSARHYLNLGIGPNGRQYHLLIADLATPGASGREGSRPIIWSRVLEGDPSTEELEVVSEQRLPLGEYFAIPRPMPIVTEACDGGPCPNSTYLRICVVEATARSYVVLWRAWASIHREGRLDLPGGTVEVELDLPPAPERWNRAGQWRLVIAPNDGSPRLEGRGSCSSAMHSTWIADAPEDISHIVLGATGFLPTMVGMRQTSHNPSRLDDLQEIRSILRAGTVRATEPLPSLLFITGEPPDPELTSSGAPQLSMRVEDILAAIAVDLDSPMHVVFITSPDFSPNRATAETYPSAIVHFVPDPVVMPAGVPNPSGSRSLREMLELPKSGVNLLLLDWFGEIRGVQYGAEERLPQALEHLRLQLQSRADTRERSN